MKKVTLVILVIMLICTAATAPAFAAEAESGLSVSVGLLSSTDKGNDVGVGKSLSLAYDLPIQLKACRLQAAVSYVSFTGGYDDVSISEKVIPVTIRAIRDLKPTRSYKPYTGLGIGIMQLNATASKGHESESLSNTTYCYELLAGADFKESYYVELKALGSPDSDVGIGLNVGYRF